MPLAEILKRGNGKAAPALPKNYVETSYGRIAYLERGKAGKPPILFVHGIPTSSYLWRNVMDALADRFHCYAPDLMGLGDTEVDVGTTAFNMDAQAEMLADFMSAVGHERFGLVCHDQGGAAAQILATRHPERISAWVITDCVGYDNWPVPLIARTQDMAKIPVLPELLSRTGLAIWLQQRPKLSQFRTGVYKKENLTDEAIHEYLRPTLTKEGWDRFRAFLLAGDSKYSEAVVPELKKFKKPTLVLWAGDDRYLSISWAKRFLDDIPGAKDLEIVPFCGHFWQEERPQEFAERMGVFFSKHLRAGTAKKKTAGKPGAKKKRTSRRSAAGARA